MLPTTPSPQALRSSASRARPDRACAEKRVDPNHVDPTGGLPPIPGAKDPLIPIGPTRLRALREAIRDGSYPSDADVMGGLERMLERPEDDS